jgi:hypothetical protein
LHAHRRIWCIRLCRNTAPIPGSVSANTFVRVAKNIILHVCILFIAILVSHSGDSLILESSRLNGCFAGPSDVAGLSQVSEVTCDERRSLLRGLIQSTANKVCVFGAGAAQALVSRCMKVMSPIGRCPGSETHSTLCMSFARTRAINAKVDEAARPRQFATSRIRRVSACRFLGSMDVVIFELPIELRRCFRR